MEKTFSRRIFSVGITLVLIAAMALFGSACGKSEEKANENTSTASSLSEKTVIGAGETQFTLVVENGADVKEFLVNTDKELLGEALLELNLIYGSEGQYGLVVETVDGVTLDFETDSKYWALYENGNYATTGIDKIEVKAGATYSLKAENG